MIDATHTSATGVGHAGHADVAHAGHAHPDPTQRPIWPGTSGPAAGTPSRAVPSLRRTTAVDIVFGDAGELSLRGSGRDLLTTASGAREADAASTVVSVDLLTRWVGAVDAWHGQTAGLPGDRVDEAVLQALVGLPAGGAFRKALSVLLPDDAAAGTLLAQLLDETPAVSLIAGSSLARRQLTPDQAEGNRRSMADICSGWRSGGLMLRAVEDGTTLYLGEGPPAPSLERADDPLAWHALDVLPAGSMRRRRRLDLTPSTAAPGCVELDVLFRDSYIEPDGCESVVHEYAIVAVLDGDGTIRSVDADPHVLPGPQCPAAAASAERLVGQHLGDVRRVVTTTFSGTSTCTHLSDALRSVGTLTSSLAHLRAALAS